MNVVVVARIITFLLVRRPNVDKEKWILPEHEARAFDCSATLVSGQSIEGG